MPVMVDWTRQELYCVLQMTCNGGCQFVRQQYVSVNFHQAGSLHGKPLLGNGYFSSASGSLASQVVYRT